MAGRVLLLTISALLLVACGGKQNGDGRAQSTTTTTTTTPATTSAQTLAGASTDPSTWKGSSREVELLTDVRATSHAGYDRLVFQFRDGLPGYDIRYVEPPVRADGSGAVVTVAGEAVLRARFEPALDADLTQESAPRTYTGPTRFSPAGSAVVELVRTGGFEAVLTWAVGVDARRPFRVSRLEDPARIVIDIAGA